jgi:hypothetical protein
MIVASHVFFSLSRKGLHYIMISVCLHLPFHSIFSEWQEVLMCCKCDYSDYDKHNHLTINFNCVQIVSPKLYCSDLRVIKTACLFFSHCPINFDPLCGVHINVTVQQQNGQVFIEGLELCTYIYTGWISIWSYGGPVKRCNTMWCYVVLWRLCNQPGAMASGFFSADAGVSVAMVVLPALLGI